MTMLFDATVETGANEKRSSYSTATAPVRGLSFLGDYNTILLISIGPLRVLSELALFKAYARGDTRDIRRQGVRLLAVRLLRSLVILMEDVGGTIVWWHTILGAEIVRVDVRVSRQ